MRERRCPFFISRGGRPDANRGPLVQAELSQALRQRIWIPSQQRRCAAVVESTTLLSIGVQGIPQSNRVRMLTRKSLWLVDNMGLCQLLKCLFIEYIVIMKDDDSMSEVGQLP